MTLLPLVWRTVRAQRAALVALGLLVLITAFLVDACPRTLVRGYDRAARDTITEAPMGAPDVLVTTSLPPVEPAQMKYRRLVPTSTAAGLAARGEKWRAQLPPRLRNTIVTSDRVAASDFQGVIGAQNRQLSFAFSGTADRHIRYTSGHAPGAPTGTDDRLRLEVGLPVAAAREIGVKPGDVLRFSGETLTAHVSGLFAPVDPKDGYWPSHQRFLVAEREETRDGAVIFLATALLDPAGYAAMSGRTDLKVNMTWTYTPGASRVTARSAAGLSDDVHHAAETIMTSRGGYYNTTVSTRLDHLLDDYVRRLRTAQTLLSLTLAGLFATSLGVLALTAQLLLSRMRTALTTQAARGASPSQLAALTAGTVALVTLPAAALGLALAALLVSGPAQTVSYVAAAVLVVVTIALPTVAAARVRRRAGRSSPRRLVAELLVVVLAVSGAYLLRRRGLTTNTGATGIDPLLSAVPALLAVAAGLLTLRAYPYPLRLVSRVLARGRSAVAFVGFARASRRHSASVLPLLVLLLAVAVIGFGGTVRASLSRAQSLATWESVGGEARVDAQILDPAMVERVRHSPGVRAITPVQILDTARLTTADGEVSDELPVVGVDLDAYCRMMAGTPLSVPALPKPSGSAVPALFSPAAAAATKAGGITLSTDYGLKVPLVNVGSIERFPTQDAGGQFIVMPYSAMARATVGQVPGSIFVRGDHIDLDALRRNAGVPALGPLGINPVTTYRATYDSITGGELGRLVGSGFGVAAILVACYGTLAILVLLFSGAQARGRSVSYLRTLGLSRRQTHGLAFVEVAPPLFAAAIAGWALGVGLPSIVGPALDLRTYTGGFPVARQVLDIASTAALTGGLLAFAALAVLVDAVVGTRRRLGSVLRIGDT